MDESGKPLVPLMQELTALRQRVATLEAAATTRQQAEDARRESEAKFRNVVHGSLQGILVHRHHKPLFVNQAFAEMLGYATPEDILRMDSTLLLVAPHERTRLIAYCAARLHGEDVPTQYAYQALCQDGTLIWAEVRATAVQWDGAPAILLTMVDITARKQAEAVLARYQLLSDWARDIILFIRRDGQIVEANHAAVAAYGYDRETLLTMNIYDLRDPATAPLVAPQMAQADMRGILFETRHQRKDGSTFPVEVSSVGAEIGGERLLLSIIRDITARKQAEQALQQAHAELEQRVQERTAALVAANDVLRRESAERQRLEREAQRAQHFALLGRLAAGVSHEIRNPLGVIFLHVDLLEEELHQPTPDSSDQIALSLTEIKTHLARLDELVQDYLLLVRVTSIQRDVQDLGAAVQAWAAEVQGRAAAQGVMVCLEGIEHLGLVAFHTSTLRRAMLNLVQNALDAMPNGGMLILAGQHTTTQVQLRVRDTGCGIPAERLGQIFEPLYTTKPGGTGLGLYIVQEIVAAHAGQITVHSVEGQGTTFTIMLSQAATEAPAQEEPARQADQIGSD